MPASASSTSQSFYRYRDCVVTYHLGSSNDREVCTGLSDGARIGIAFGVFFLVMLLFVALGASRRRRIHRANQAYITNANTTQSYPAPGYNYPQNGYDPANVAGQGPQYPPPAHSYDQYNGAPTYNSHPYSHVRTYQADHVILRMTYRYVLSSLAALRSTLLTRHHLDLPRHRRNDDMDKLLPIVYHSRYCIQLSLLRSLCDICHYFTIY